MKYPLCTCLCFALLTLLPLNASAQSGVPDLCKPCLFYAGDLNPDDPNADSFDNENTLNGGNQSTYAAVTVPQGHTILVEGILFQTLFTGTSAVDPYQAPWQIRSGDISNQGGTLVASGQGKVFIQRTGRTFQSQFEYSVRVDLTPAVALSGGESKGGTTYWFNITPQCANLNDPECFSAGYSVSNTTQQTNGFHAGAQPRGSGVIDSATSGYDWASLCHEFAPDGCYWLSFGLIGREQFSLTSGAIRH